MALTPPCWRSGVVAVPLLAGLGEREMRYALALTGADTLRQALAPHGLLAELHDRLRGRVREDTGRDSEPTVAIIDSQSVTTDATVPAASRRFDGGKKVNGRKRHVLDVVPRLSLKAGVAVRSIREVGDTVASRPEEARRGTASGRHHAEAPEELPSSGEGLECKPEQAR
ncbi:hypothetical protein [Streptomyces xanthochromogenes]|uniref:hypothetical protein n=1 Tax=Streptomyces xanthochromogenes TaxID=67384 RepID=UPI0034383E6D